MDNLDGLIGQNLARLRGDLSQADLAKKMKELGYKWSQATVWSIEKGERPLRLSEARDVVGVVGSGGSLYDLLHVPDVARLREAVTNVSRENANLRLAMDEYWKALNELAITADLVADGNEVDQIPAHLWEAVEDWLIDGSLVPEARQAEARNQISEDLEGVPGEMVDRGVRTFEELVRHRAAEAKSKGFDDYESHWKSNMETVGNYSGMIKTAKKNADGEHSEEA